MRNRTGVGSGIDHGKKRIGPISVPQEDSAFPGENLFFYWKTSASLWRTKLQVAAPLGPIMVPVNWSLHVSEDDGFDFADSKPETDLFKLVSIAEELGKAIVFLMPVTPVPFLPNGGIPHLLARHLSYDEDGLVNTVVDANDSLHKIYSFFDSQVFVGYAKFVRALGDYLKSKSINVDIWGLEAGRVRNRTFKSFLFDRSPTYYESFNKYLKELDISTSVMEENHSLHHDNFYGTIRKVYIEQAKTALDDNWEGIIKVGFLGSAHTDIIERMEMEENSVEQVRQVAETLCTEVLPSSALLPRQSKIGSLKALLEEIVVRNTANEFSGHKLQTEERGSFFTPLRFFNIHHLSEGGARQTNVWENSCLYEHIGNRYRWTYTDVHKPRFTWEEYEGSDVIHFFQSSGLSKTSFHDLIRLFMRNGKIVLDTSQIDREYQKKLESFIIENSLKVEYIKFHVEIKHISLGDGRLVITNINDLASLAKDVCASFWSRVIDTFEINHPIIPNIAGVEYIWSVRRPTGNELDYKEVRKVNIYNPSSYRRRPAFNLPKSFKIMGISETHGVTVHNGPHNVSMELPPNSCVAIQFGVF